MDAQKYTIGDELEPLELWWTGNGGRLVDFSVAHTYSAKLALDSDDTRAPIFSIPKTTGFTGATGSGNRVSGTPNLTLAWAISGELNDVTAEGLYLLEIVATRTSDSRQRTGYVLLDMGARFP